MTALSVQEQLQFSLQSFPALLALLQPSSKALFSHTCPPHTLTASEGVNSSVCILKHMWETSQASTTPSPLPAAPSHSKGLPSCPETLVPPRPLGSCLSNQA